MLKKTYYTNGENKFKNNTFSDEEWSAPYMVSKTEFKRTLDGFKLEGRIIRDLRFVSHAYNLIPRWVEEYAYMQLEGLPEEEQYKKSEYCNIDPDMQYLRYAEIDEPLLIWFEDNEHFEIDAPRDFEFRASMNCIPWDIREGCNASNAHAAILFDSCIGRKIVEVEVVSYNKSEESVMFSDCSDGEESDYIKEVVLWLDNSTGICISPDYDYTDVTIIDRQREIQKLPFSQLKKALFNWEDIYND